MVFASPCSLELGRCHSSVVGSLHVQKMLNLSGYRELVHIGKGQVGTSETEWILDACVLVIEKEPALLYGQQCSQHAMVSNRNTSLR
jgi:hypothetical protein